MNMHYLEKNIFGTLKYSNKNAFSPQLIGANTLIGNNVYGQNNEDLGDIKEIMFDVHSGKLCYVVLLHSGFLATDEKLLAVPWQALKLDADNKRYVLNIDLARLGFAPSFDTNHWPNMEDEKWADSIHSFYGTFFKRSDSMHSCM